MSITRTINTEDARAAAATVRALVAAVDAGEVEADSSERAYRAALDQIIVGMPALDDRPTMRRRRHR
jgi:hypothetical protein